MAEQYVPSEATSSGFDQRAQRSAPSSVSRCYDDRWSGRSAGSVRHRRRRYRDRARAV
ncbi:hypothetical protein DB32_007379 [Sandaracinus amylolyticus]|uniref:Uncharacterized protein n=1 Tax=Sandaracinus amylolyticus TaxID=927083 RepID=A0A0F6W8P0_9BACT|nr:hypothetical protein DB32_007379 [Sandaracinus amylolyticus]